MFRKEFAFKNVYSVNLLRFVYLVYQTASHELSENCRAAWECCSTGLNTATLLATTFLNSDYIIILYSFPAHFRSLSLLLYQSTNQKYNQFSSPTIRETYSNVSSRTKIIKDKFRLQQTATIKTAKPSPSTSSLVIGSLSDDEEKFCGNLIAKQRQLKAAAFGLALFQNFHSRLSYSLSKIWQNWGFFGFGTS